MLLTRSYDYDAPSLTSRDDDEEEEDDDPKICSKSAQNRVCCSLGYGIRYIGTPNFCEKVLWVYESPKVCPTNAKY